MNSKLALYLSFFAFLITSQISVAQSSLKQERANEQQIEATIDLFFDGLKDGNLNKMKRAVWEDATLVSTFVDIKGQEQIRQSTMKDFLEAAAKPRNDKWNEKIWDLKIESSGRLGHAIMEYAFFLNDTFVHCGANAIQLAFIDGQWTIVSLADTRMKNECDRKEIEKRFK